MNRFLLALLQNQTVRDLSVVLANQFSTVDIYDLCTLLQSKNSVENLFLQSGGVCSNAISLNLLSQMSSLRCLYLHCVPLKHYDSVTIAFEQLCVFRWTHTQISDYVLSEVLDALSSCKTMHTLNLSYSTLELQSLETICVAVSQGTWCIKTLLLERCWHWNWHWNSGHDSALLTNYRATVLASTAMEHLDLSSNCLDFGTNALYNLLDQNSTLRHLSLQGALISDLDLTRIMEGLSNNTVLETLDISRTDITMHGIRMLTGMKRQMKCQRDCALKNLIMWPTRDFVRSSVKPMWPTHDCARSLVKTIEPMLPFLDSLTEIRLSNARCGDAFACRLVNALRRVTSVKLLDLDNNDLGCESVKAIRGLLGSNWCFITELNLCNNVLGDVAVREVTRNLARNHQLEILRLTNTDMGNDGFESLFNVLVHNRTLMCLELRNNSRETISKPTLFDVLAVNRSLEYLFLKGVLFSRPCIDGLYNVLTHRNTPLKMIELDTCVNPSSSKSMVDVLQNNSRLSEIAVGTSHSFDCDRFTQALRTNLRVRKLHNYTYYTTEQRKIQIAMLRRNQLLHACCASSDDAWPVMSEELLRCAFPLLLVGLPPYVVLQVCDLLHAMQCSLMLNRMAVCIADECMRADAQLIYKSMHMRHHRRKITLIESIARFVNEI